MHALLSLGTEWAEIWLCGVSITNLTIIYEGDELNLKKKSFFEQP